MALTRGYPALGGNTSTPTPSDHETIDTLVHNLAENAWDELIYTGKDLTSLTVWTSPSKLLRIRDSTFTYTGKNLTGVVTRQFASDGITVAFTLTKTLVYSGKNLIEVTSVKI